MDGTVSSGQKKTKKNKKRCTVHDATDALHSPSLQKQHTLAARVLFSLRARNDPLLVHLVPDKQLHHLRHTTSTQAPTPQ